MSVLFSLVEGSSICNCSHFFFFFPNMLLKDVGETCTQKINMFLVHLEADIEFTKFYFGNFTGKND